MKKQIIELLEKYEFTQNELDIIYKFIFYLYTNDLDLIENELKYRIRKSKTKEEE